MPLIKIDIVEGRSEQDIRKMLDAIHSAVLEAFHVPKGDRYQIVTQHKSYEMVLEDTDLGFTREQPDIVAITVISRKRECHDKVTFYRLIKEGLEKELGIAPQNILISITENGDADWSFGFGEAQFITGKLQ
ncbi:tautomerase family protein [Enterococcus sp. 669A]|uniref:Tautomerase family protein n=1 Tax=Candidatus Enterococcus moelleringii TaxID=2815325 RepID=A0ABS3LBS8_9ENTE|nr:tautomerase family protein [Enterococcus sp. 669A]MBO1307090.1 tautomerase family protein [Enterococcus sp. 669A]